jgi:amino acid adenylation domain-containing protein
VSAEQTLDRPAAGLSAAKRAILDARLRGLNRPQPIPRGGPRTEAPLSFAQERLWFLERVGQGGATYNIPAARRLRGSVDAAALERALGWVVRRHEVLRTTFREVEGVAEQVVGPFTGFPLPLVDLTHLPADEREAEVARLATADASRPFDLSAGPLFRAKLLRLGDDEHVLLLCMHHAVSDGWSMRVLFRELWALYDAFREGREPALPDLPVQYADYAVWQRGQAGGEAQARQLAYWRERLAGSPELLELPTDRPRPPAPSFRGAAVPVHVPASVLGRLRDLAMAEGATLYMVVLAAFQALLARYAGTDDVVVGAPIAGRTRREVEDVIGLFVNTLVLRTDLSGDPTFRRAVGRVRETVLGAYENQEVPFERVVAELQPERTLSHSALFQVMFMLDTVDGPSSSAAGSASGDGPAAEGVGVRTGTTKFDLTLALDAGEGGVTGMLDYSTDLFDRETALRMARHLERTLEQAARDPDVRLSGIDLVPDDERARIADWNATAAWYPADRCIHQLFQEQAGRTPHEPAVTFGAETLTYRELDRAANRLAHRLARLGVGPEVRVGLCMERGTEILVAILAVLKAGGAYVPMDASHPADRLAYVLADSGVKVLLTQERLRGRLPVDSGLEIVCVERPSAASVEGVVDVETESASPPETGVDGENLAYVIYTSGSTGRPKGVAMHHRGVCNYVHWGVRAYGAGEGNGAPVFSSMAVDLTITNLLPLFAGRPVRMLPEESPVEALAQALREGPDFGLVKITPIHVGLLNTLLRPEHTRGAVRTLVVGADFLVAEPTLFWQEHAPGVRLMNEYGPTETVVGCSEYVLPSGRHRAGPVPVGRPIENITFHVLDERLRQVPVGLPGELFIGGAGVARGYLGRPGLTAEKFVPDPFAGTGARMYRTGDRARWLDEGSLIILGRTDNQVKVRGYRVELGEVETALRRHPGVAECVAVLREDRPGDRRLVAYVVADPERTDAAALREHLRGTLPEYMVPDAFVVLRALPQTPTGKLDRKTLPAPEYGRAQAESALPAGSVETGPADEVEAELAAVWEDVLGVDGVGPADNFFALGGNSLLALRLFAQTNRRLGCDLPVSTLFTGATVRDMARAVREQRRSSADAASPVVALQPAGTLPPLFCVHPAGRDVINYVELARHLGSERPVLGLRDLGEDLSRPIPQIAAGHVQAVRAAQPRGPYHLAGWSFGGYVAYEMALQLERMGEEVAFVGLLDTMSPVLARERQGSDDVHLVIGMAADVAAQMGRPFHLRREELEGLDPDEQVRRAVEALHAHGAAPRDFDVAALREHCQVIRDRRRSLLAYEPDLFAGTLTLFRASIVTDEYEAFFAPRGDEERHTLGWCALAPGRVRVVRVPGAHVTLGSEPHVPVLADRLRESVAAARPRAAHAPDNG